MARGFREFAQNLYNNMEFPQPTLLVFLRHYG